MRRALSILIPSRNEEFLNRTIGDILEHIEGDTEIIVVLDGCEEVLIQNERVRYIHNKTSLGQRKSTNQACKLSEAKYVMKVDAHCAFDQGFDVKMMAKMQPNWTMVPLMRNLHAFNWVCQNGHTRYQSPSGPCTECGEPTAKDVVWIPKTNPQSTSYCFDEEPHFQYFKEYKVRPEGKGDITESMSLQGSCFMMTREKYWELNICDEALGSWGSQGIEVACKTWLSGGRVVCNQTTWYAHLFRTQGGDFGFPYQQSYSKVQDAKRTVRELFFDNKWEKQVYPLSWLLERFAPIPGWSPEMVKKIKDWPLPKHKQLSVGVLYYTDNCLEDGLFKQCQDQIKACLQPDMRLVSVSLKPIDFGDNIRMYKERGVLTLFTQILAGLKELKTDIVFFTEHDVLYHPSHFDFRPANKDVYYYNMNLWRVRKDDGFAIKYDHKSLSQLCAYREKLIPEFEERIRRIKEEGVGKMSYEPGTRSIRSGGFSNDRAEGFWSKFPNLDIRHGKNLSRSKWRPEDFNSPRSCRNWEESKLNKILGWKDIVIK